MISKKTINAIELCVVLASQRGEGYLTTTDLAARLDLSVSYLENILKLLKMQGIVLSLRGPGGGYMVKGDLSLISIWDIACLFEKTLADTVCVSEANLHQSYELELEQVVLRTLKDFSLSDFAGCSSPEVKPYSNAVGRFKFKPLPVTFMPKAPNSVFQLHMSL